MAGEEATLNCSDPGCGNLLAQPALRIMSGAGEIHDFCNKTCLREFMKGLK